MGWDWIVMEKGKGIGKGVQRNKIRLEYNVKREKRFGNRSYNEWDGIGI